MWYIYTCPDGEHYPLEMGFRLIRAEEVSHDYDKMTAFCRDGCPDYSSGGCPPYAPGYAQLATDHPYGLMVYAKFLSRFKPAGMASDDFSLQDVVLSDALSQLGYAVVETCQGDLFFLNCGHCRGCGEDFCILQKAEAECLRPERRAYSIAATGVDVAATLQGVFDIQLQWLTEDTPQVEYIIKVIAFLSSEPEVLQMIAKDLVNRLNSLQCTRLTVGSLQYQQVLNQLVG